MSNFPPRTPLNYATPPSQGRTDLRQIAVRQRIIMICILAGFILVASRSILPPELQPYVIIPVLGVILTASVFCFLLAIAIFGVSFGILMGVLTLVPFVGVLSLLMVNAEATNILRENGIKVGLMGAKLSLIPAAGNVYR